MQMLPSSPQDTKLKTINGEAPTVDLSFQLLSSEVSLQIRGRLGPGSYVPPPVAPQWVPTSFTIAGLVQGRGQGVPGGGNCCF